MSKVIYRENWGREGGREGVVVREFPTEKQTCREQKRFWEMSAVVIVIIGALFGFSCSADRFSFSPAGALVTRSPGRDHFDTESEDSAGSTKLTTALRKVLFLLSDCRL